jgi:4-hydroxybenzoyl-CoA reductase subunit alpha
MVKAFNVPQAEETAEEDLKIIGKPFRRVDGRAKVTGQTRFADDVQFPRTAHVKLVRSTVPHARIKNIDLSDALAMHGVLGTLVGDELPGSFGIMPVSEDEHALAIDTVRFVGDPVAAIAAVSEDVAHAAALAVKVEYELLPTISSVDDALATPEPQIHDYADDGNIHKKVSLKFGEVEQGFDDADLILEDNFFYEGSNHLALEQHASIAVTEDDDRVTVYSATQCPHYVHRALTKTLDIPASRIRVIVLLPSRPPPGADAPENRLPQGRHDDVAAFANHVGRRRFR